MTITTNERKRVTNIQQDILFHPLDAKFPCHPNWNWLISNPNKKKQQPTFGGVNYYMLLLK